MKVGSVPSVSNGGSVTFVDRGSAAKVSGALLRRYNRAARTVASLWVSDCDLSSPDVGVSLALSSSCNHSISALAAVSSAWGFKTVTVSLSEVFAGPVAALLAAVFWGMVAGVVVIPGKFFRGVVCVSCGSLGSVLGFCFVPLGCDSVSLGFLFCSCSWSWFWFCPWFRRYF